MKRSLTLLLSTALSLCAPLARAHDDHSHHHDMATMAPAESTAPVPPLSILLPQNGAVVSPQLAVIFKTPGRMADLTMGAAQMGTHLHIESAGVSLMPMVKQLIRLGPDTYLFLFDLEAKPGAQTIRVYWSDAMHRTIASSVNEVRVTVAADAARQ